MKLKTAGNWNPRFVEYARVHGRTAEAQLAFDDERYPGGRMCGFILWNGDRLREWKKLVDYPCYCDYRGNPIPGDYWPLTDLYHAQYNAWLAVLPVGHGVQEEKKS